MDKKTILVVDDAAENITMLRDVLRSEFKVLAALDGETALALSQGHNQPDMILLDIMMPDMDGYQVCQQLKANPRTKDIPVIFVTAKTDSESEKKGLEIGAVDYIFKPVSPPIVLARVHTHMQLADQRLYLEKEISKRTEELHSTRLEIIHHLGRAAEFKDNETGLHVIRMSHYSRLIAEKLSDSSYWIDLIFNAAPMHDIGKIGIPDSILLKPGKLNTHEWELMQKHTQFGADIIGDHPSELLKMSKEIALTHHEKWDGSGYPNNLLGETIPLTGRIAAVADVFDALTSVRPYKQAWPVELATDYIVKNSGSHFDPEIVSVFTSVLSDILEIKEYYEEQSPATNTETTKYRKLG